jgi:hypothetical protein
VGTNIGLKPYIYKLKFIKACNVSLRAKSVMQQSNRLHANDNDLKYQLFMQLLFDCKQNVEQQYFCGRDTTNIKTRQMSQLNFIIL